MALTYIGASKAVISASGDYTIDRDLTQHEHNEAGVYVNPGVPHVTIRLRSRVECDAGSGGWGSGIEATGCTALTLIGDGGSIRGFGFGVRLENCYLARVRGLFLRDALFRGIFVRGDDAAITDCDIRGVTGETAWADAWCMGIEVQGTTPTGRGPKVLSNHVEEIYGMAAGESVGISISDRAMGAIVHGNTIRNGVRRAGSYGLWLGGQSSVVASHNMLQGWESGISFPTGVTGTADENAFVNCGVPIQGARPGVIVGPGDMPDMAA